MSLLEEISKKKLQLQSTKTILTNNEGKKFIEDNKTGTLIELKDEKSCGFIIDTSPDYIPALILEENNFKIYLGSQDSVTCENICEYNIKNILSIGIETPPLPNRYLEIVKTTFIQCLDLPETNIKSIIINCNEIINEICKNNESILIHCNAGVSRSTSIVLGFLIKERKMSFDDAFNLVKSKRSCIRPNDGFMKQLKEM